MTNIRRPEARMSSLDRKTVLLISSPGAREAPDSPLLRFARDYRDRLRDYDIIATEHTGRSLIATGLYEEVGTAPHGNVTLKRSGRNGGIVELAALAAEGKCQDVVCLVDSADVWADAADFRALKRLCIQRQLHLVTTVAGAEHWLMSKPTRSQRANWDTTPSWPPGTKNREGETFVDLKRGEQTLALIAHDGMKLDLIRFVLNHLEFLSGFHRILTTGTTGLLLQCVLSDRKDKRRQFCKDALRREETKERRKRIRDFAAVGEALWMPSRKHPMPEDEKSRKAIAELIRALKERKTAPWARTSDRDLLDTASRVAGRICRLPSGPDGGDILIAAEVLENKCHAIVFLQDPNTAHPHSTDIRLLEKTCTIPSVRAVCVGSLPAANAWVRRESHRKRDEKHPKSRARQLCEIYPGLRDAVIVCTSDLISCAGPREVARLPAELMVRSKPAPLLRDAINADIACDQIGDALARAAAGYFHRLLSQLLVTTKETVGVGISWGHIARRVAEEIPRINEQQPLLLSVADSTRLRWRPMIGLVQSKGPGWEANSVASMFQRTYQLGEREAIPHPAFDREARDEEIGEFLKVLVERHATTKLVLTSLGPESMSSWLWKKTSFDRAMFPTSYSAHMTGVFLDSKGSQQSLKGGYSLMGLGGSDLTRIAAEKGGGVILVASGQERYVAIRAALRSKCVSVLITTENTADGLVKLRNPRRLLRQPVGKRPVTRSSPAEPQR
jgi:methylglyoxal synthase/DNA-binding transcriptional regulator LsrR (DeoR family)